MRKVVGELRRAFVADAIGNLVASRSVRSTAQYSCVSIRSQAHLLRCPTAESSGVSTNSRDVQPLHS